MVAEENHHRPNLATCSDNGTGRTSIRIVIQKGASEFNAITLNARLWFCLEFTENRMLPSDWLKQIRAVYPRRNNGQGWGNVKKLVPELIKKGESFEDLLDGAKRYGEFCAATNEKYVRMAQTFFGPGEWWLEDYDIPRDGSVELTMDQQAEDLGIKRQPGESDESFSHRFGIAQTQRMYAK